MKFGFALKLLRIGCVDSQKVGDGYCDDETNIAECSYDGGDCCGLNVNRKFCRTCKCLGPGNIK